MPDEEQKIIIDEGWKNQVEREKKEAAEAPVEEPDAAPDAEGEIPEASFTTLMSSLAMQTMLALGVVPQPGSEQVMVDLDQAKFSIDTMLMLREKTAGNLTPEEEGGLREALAELQRVYVARVQQFQEQAMREAGIDPTSLPPGQ